MTDSRLLQLQALLLEGVEITDPEKDELDKVRKGTESMSRLLQDDERMHTELRALVRINATRDDFVQRCLSAASAETTSGNEPNIENENAVLRRDLISAPRLELGRPADRLRRNRKIRKPTSTHQVIGWLSAAIAIMLIGFVAWWWTPRSAEGPRIATKPGETPVGQSALETRIHEDDNKLAEEFDRNLVEPKSDSGTSSTLEVVESAMDPETSNSNLNEPSEVNTDLTRLASLRFSPESVWGQKPAESGVFPARYGLRSGIAELVLSDGTRLVFQGPANLTMESPRQLHVEEGQIRIEPVAASDGFSVSTPTVWLDGSDNVLAYLNVRPAEGTAVQIEQGELSARPWANGSESEILLSDKALNRGLFGPEWREDSTQPATAIAMNGQGDFNGIVSAADRQLSITSPAVFAQILDVSRSMIREDGHEFPKQWQGMVDELNEAVTNMDVQFENQSVRPRTAGEMLDQMGRIREQMMSGYSVSGGNGVSGTVNQQSAAFSGVLNVNGVEQRFSSPEEFKAVQSKIFGPVVGRMMFGTPNDEPDNSSSAIQSLFPGSLMGNGNTPGGSNTSSSFSGMINNNGQSMEFTSPEEFNRAMQQFRRQ